MSLEQHQQRIDAVIEQFKRGSPAGIAKWNPQLHGPVENPYLLALLGSGVEANLSNLRALWKLISVMPKDPMRHQVANIYIAAAIKKLLGLPWDESEEWNKFLDEFPMGLPRKARAAAANILEELDLEEAFYASKD
jgi:hypothetical protein